jgi:UDP-N-acetylglucosamine 2-epimerase
MPEEVNRVVTDHVSTLLFCPTQTAVDNLGREGITRGVRRTGDVMLDLCRARLPDAERRAPALLRRLAVEAGGYVVATVHRAGNTDDGGRLAAIVSALGALEAPVIFPMHPRTQRSLAERPSPANLRIIEPLGYLEMLALLRHAHAVLTDSGGVQKESFFVGTPCLTLRHGTEWPETLTNDWNRLVVPDGETLRAAIRDGKPAGVPAVDLFGDGQAGAAVVAGLESFV